MEADDALHHSRDGAVTVVMTLVVIVPMAAEKGRCYGMAAADPFQFDP